MRKSVNSEPGAGELRQSQQREESLKVSVNQWADSQWRKEDDEKVDRSAIDQQQTLTEEQFPLKAIPPLYSRVFRWC